MENNETLDTYNNSSKDLADYFAGIGSRVKYIDLALDLAGKSDGSADVLELGCGDGRDAVDIIKRTHSYTGIDYSAGLIGLAKKLLPAADFRVVDMQNFDFQAHSYDVIFAFASVLHIDMDGLAKLLAEAAESLRPGGIFYISTKYSEHYRKEWVEDKHGKRLFFYYSPELITRLAKDYYSVASSEISTDSGKPWIEMALRKD